MVEMLHCAVCGDAVPMDGSHARVSAELVRPRDRDGRAEFYLHRHCYEAVTAGWSEP